MGKDFCRFLMMGFLLLSFLMPATGLGQESIKIGLILPLSGTYAQPGKDSYNGAIFYLEKIEYMMAGRKVELISEDEEASPAVALTKARKLIELNKVNLLAGPLLTNCAYAVQPYQESKKVPGLLIASADDLTQRKRGNWSIRVGYSSSQATHERALTRRASMSA